MKRFEERCPDGQKCGAHTTGCIVGQCQRSALPPMPSELLLLAKDPLMGPALVEWGRRLIASRSENEAPVPSTCQYGKDVGMPEYHCAVACQYAHLDPGTEKILRTLLDRAYKMMLQAGYRVMEHDPDQNDPIGAWMSGARVVLYGNGPQPDLTRLK